MHMQRAGRAMDARMGWGLGEGRCVVICRKRGPSMGELPPTALSALAKWPAHHYEVGAITTVNNFVERSHLEGKQEFILQLKVTVFQLGGVSL